MGQVFLPYVPEDVGWETLGIFPIMEQFGFGGMLIVTSYLGLKFVFKKLD